MRNTIRIFLLQHVRKYRVHFSNIKIYDTKTSFSSFFWTQEINLKFFFYFILIQFTNFVFVLLFVGASKFMVFFCYKIVLRIEKNCSLSVFSLSLMLRFLLFSNTSNCFRLPRGYAFRDYFFVLLIR